MDMDRRQFLEFLSASAAFSFFGGALTSCTSLEKWARGMAFKPLEASTKDDLVLAEGFSYKPLISWGEAINSKGQTFGFNNDYIQWSELSGSSSLVLWVNHEYVDPLIVSQSKRGESRTKAQIENEMRQVGGSLLKVDPSGSSWKVDFSSIYNRRLDAFSKIPFSNGEIIAGSSVAIGTLANCAGGKTPWGSFLTCEENYDGFVGEVEFTNSGKRILNSRVSKKYGWSKHYPRPPEHYGWVVEVNPLTGEAVKHTGLGRFAHECATCTISKSGELVVYSGDDSDDEHLYKFVSDSRTSLKSGKLYVASLEQGRWILLDRESDARLKAKFPTQLDLLIRVREAAKILGATPLDRPEDIEIHPHTGDVIVALTNNKKKGNPFGSLLKIVEKGADSSSLDFESSTLLAGGEESGFSCPDNLAFDGRGDLWFTTDVSNDSLHEDPYKFLGNNSLFYLPLSGAGMGRAHRVASGPVGSELTGPCFSPDGNTLFLSVQHPGEKSPSLKELTSHWPGGGDSLPKPSVVMVDVRKVFS
ncbi:MAG: DUF839 domain-containing protein [Bdellovibrionales bacterium]|nr:DUF839 domain-containing protein [Bdellovibrionales bacterium]